MRVLSMFFLLSILLFGLFGCMSNSMIPLTDEEINKAGEVIEKTAGYTKDASVAKEHEVHATLRNRDKQIAAAQSNSGMKMKWVTVEETIYMPGSTQPIIVKRAMPEVSYTEPAKFNQQLPTAPSEHPLWKTVRETTKDVVNGTVIGMGINKAGEVLEKAIDQKETVVEEGGKIEYNQSHNQGNGTGPTTETVIGAGEGALAGSASNGSASTAGSVSP